MNRFAAPLSTLVLLAAALAAGQTTCPSPGSPLSSRARRDLWSDRCAGGEEKPDAFLLGHLAEQAYPAAPSDPAFRRVLVASRPPAAVVSRRTSPGTPLRAWTFLGPSRLAQPTAPETPAWENFSGRATALAVARDCSTSACRVWLGTAGGGIWRTDEGLSADDPAWRHLENGIPGNTIGSLTLDPNDGSSLTLYAGTGEANFNFTSGAGTGLFLSRDGGDSWRRVPTEIVDSRIAADRVDFTATRGIAQIVVKPGDPSTIYVATTEALAGMTAVRGGQVVTTGRLQAPVGLYRTRDGGVSWALIWIPPAGITGAPGVDVPAGASEFNHGVRDVRLDPREPETIYATAFQNGIFRSSPSLENGDATFKPVFALVGPDDRGSLAGMALTVKDGHTRLYAGNGVSDRDLQGIYRLDDADVPAAFLVLSAGGSFVNGPGWISLTSPDPTFPGFSSNGYCGGQCFYDQVLAVPEGEPDTLFAGGQAATLLGDPVLRSTDAGANFQSYGYDAQDPPRLVHLDVHAIAFDPNDASIVFIASDGGIARTGGDLADGTAFCSSTYLGLEPGSPEALLCSRMRAMVPTAFRFLNAGLPTLQFFNVAADPRDPLARIMGGAQDNGTVWRNGPGDAEAWTPLFPAGDGTAACGFHPADPDILFASFQGAYFFTHFAGGAGGLDTWTFTGGPITATDEPTSISTHFSGRQFLAFDPANPDTQFTGFAHVWRTKANGGDRAFLEANCGIDQIGNDNADACGDWQPLGEKLTDPSWGDRAGGIIVAAARTKADSGTLWAATSFGRLFITREADRAEASSVSFVRLDSTSAAAPNRFVSAIVADPSDPLRAWVSYSGFDALTPERPGHVFEVVYDPSARSATWTSRDLLFGDVPVNHLARDDVSGDLYAATDTGVWRLPLQGMRWEIAGGGLPRVLTPFLQVVADKRVLLAGTHGRGIWYLPLP